MYNGKKFFQKKWEKRSGGIFFGDPERRIMLTSLFIRSRWDCYGMFPEVEKLGEEALVPCNMHEIFLGIAHRPEQLVMTNGIEDLESGRFVGFYFEPLGGETVYVVLGRFTGGDYLFFEIDKLPCQIVMLPGGLGRAMAKPMVQEAGSLPKMEATVAVPARAERKVETLWRRSKKSLLLVW